MDALYTAEIREIGNHAMMTIDDYLDAAKSQIGTGSDRELCKLLGVTSSVTSHWRTKRAWPRDDVMLQLAEIAGVDGNTALIHLNIWRTNGKARNTYETLLKSVAALSIALVFLPPSSANASGTNKTSINHLINYAIIEFIKPHNESHSDGVPPCLTLRKRLPKALTRTPARI